MATETDDPADKLRKLGERLRQGIAVDKAGMEKGRNAVKDAIRAEWERDRLTKSSEAKPGIEGARRSPEIEQDR